MCFYDYVINYTAVLYSDQYLSMTSAGTPEPRGKKMSLLFEKKKKKKQAERRSVGTLGLLGNDIPCGKENNSARR